LFDGERGTYAVTVALGALTLTNSREVEEPH